MQIFELDTLGTRLKIRIDTPFSCEEVFSDIREMLLAFDAKYSRFIPGNWLDELNRNGGGILDEDGAKMLGFSLELARLTGGIFDPVVGSRLTKLGYGSKKTTMFHGANATFADVEVSEHSVILNRGACIEFWWVGKWYALDKIVALLEKYDRFLVDFWGDIYGKWGWNVGLEDPEDFSKVIGKIHLKNGFFCTSAGSRRKFGNSHHLLNALTGQSTHHILATYIESASGMHADGYATACFITPIGMSLGLFESDTVEGVVLEGNRMTYRSTNSNIELL